MKYMIFITRSALWKNRSHYCIQCCMRNYDFRGRCSATPENRGLSKKTQRWTALKIGGGSLPVGSYLQRGSAPPPGKEPEHTSGSTPVSHLNTCLTNLSLNFFS